MIEHGLLSPLASHIVHLLIGLVGLFALWRLLIYWLPPAISFSEYLNKGTDWGKYGNEVHKSRSVYIIEMTNAGRRPVIDIQLRAYIRFFGISTNSASQIIHLALRKGETVCSIPIMNPFCTVHSGTVIRFGIDFSRIQANCFRVELREKIMNQTLLIEDMLSKGTEHQVCVIASGADRFSGSRKAFLKTYPLAKIIQEPLNLNGLHFKSTGLRSQGLAGRRSGG